MQMGVLTGKQVVTTQVIAVVMEASAGTILALGYLGSCGKDLANSDNFKTQPCDTKEEVNDPSSRVTWKGCIDAY